MRALKQIKKLRGTTLSCLVMVVLFSIFAKGFLSMYSISVILKNASILLIASYGMTIAIILGKVDVSIGANLSLSALVAAMLIKSNFPLSLAILAAILTGLCVGLINGIFIAKFKFNYWLSTFAMMGLAKGITLGWSKGNTISRLDDNFERLGNGTFLNISYITWIAIIITLIMYFITKKTKYGYDLYAVGNNEGTSALSGIKVQSVIIKTYALSGILAAIAGVLLASKSNAANPIIGDPYSFNAIAATIIGGTPFVGGKGGIIGTILGAFIFTALSHGLSLLNLTSLYQMAIIGLAIMIIIVLDVMKKNRVDLQEKRRKFEND